ncbi:MAG TPA: GAF domain-containing protein, partial [Candidatus Cybelea sp.]|nr:GAF domain-containing protein [Candidatus Cybelea sp.]
MTATLEATLADLRHANAELQKKLREFRAERDQAQAQQTASAEVLRIIASSPKDLQPVFESILANATALCDAKFGNLWLREGSAFRIAATHGAPPEYEDYLRREPVVHPDPRTGLGQILKTKKTVHVADMTSAETFKDPVRLATIELAHARTLVGVPMLSDNEVVGVLGIYRQEVRPFSDKQIDLVTSFASQAAIAIENARLLRELRQRTGDLQESLEYQIATSDVLKVISRTDLALQPVLETLVETATRLCKADHGYVFRHLEGRHHLAAAFGVTPEYREFVSQNPFVPDRGTLSGRTALERRIVHIEDVANDPEYTWSEAQKRGNLHTGLGVPLLRDNILFGLLVLYRSRVERFSDKQIQLVSTFADQAVIAIENARLIAEQREALEQQTATAEVLQVINSSPGDLVPVFDAILEKAHRLCDAPCGSLQIYDREHIRAVAVRGLPEPFAAILRQG